MQLTSDRKRRKAIVAAALAVAAIALIAVYGLADPATSWFPRCPIKAVTGYDCPGCGSQRMLHALLHGNFAQAWEMNPFLMIMVPVVALVIVSELWPDRLPRLHRAVTSPAAIVAVIAATALWTVVRNL